MSMLRKFTQHWLGIITLAYLVTFVLWRYLILPFEISLTNENAIFASFLFLPHAVRVLSAWLLGPKSLIAMIPAGIAVSLIGGSSPPQGYELLLELTLATFAASSAVMAFEFMRLCKIDAYPKDKGIVSWRTVLFGGILASIINSLGSTWLKSGYFDASLILEVITRFVLGDVMGLMSTDHLPLRKAIAEAFDLWSDNIICGVGSDEIISFLCYAYAGPGDEVIHTEHGFAMYRISTLAAGATPVEVPEDRRLTDVDAILAACNERTKIVFIANPNNPTGTMIAEAEVRRLAEGIPSHTILVLDGAYAEYVEGYDGGTRLVHSYENVVMTRTFSKLYGLGGLRVGWGYGPKHIIDTLNRIRGPFNVSLPALAAAEAAVKDQAYADQCRDENTRLRAWLANALAEHGVVVDVSFCGICGTDVHAYQSGSPYNPAICGHEWVGHVSECGDGVRGLDVGDRVVVGIAPICGRCAACRAGQSDHCQVAFVSALGRDPLGLC